VPTTTSTKKGKTATAKVPKEKKEKVPKEKKEKVPKEKKEKVPKEKKEKPAKEEKPIKEKKEKVPREKKPPKEKKGKIAEQPETPDTHTDTHIDTHTIIPEPNPTVAVADDDDDDDGLQEEIVASQTVDETAFETITDMFSSIKLGQLDEEHDFAPVSIVTTLEEVVTNSQNSHDDIVIKESASEDENGDRVVGGWKFYYTGWTADEFDKRTFVRGDAAWPNLKPVSRRGCLDSDVLRKHGLTKERMMNDALFFYQLLFPIADPKHSGVASDGRMPYFTYAAVFTNVYAATSGAGAGVGHVWETVSAPEMVKW
jgi:hypothetical protein